jgi:acid phosphatase type 7
LFARRTSRLLAAATIVCLTAPPVLAGTHDDEPSEVSSIQAEPAVMLAAGNIGQARMTVNGLCVAANRAAATGALLDANPTGIVQTLGDNVTPGDRLPSYMGCFDSTWGGEHFARTNPAPGDDEYDEYQPGVPPPYEIYFGDKAGPPGHYFYSYDVEVDGAPAWHVIVLNSQCALRSENTEEKVSCLFEMADFIERDLIANAGATCTLAVSHQPRFSSSLGPGVRRDALLMQGLWQLLHDRGVDVVLSAHTRNYERFAPMDALGRANSEGMRQFIVGTGGQQPGGPRDTIPAVPHPNSEAQIRDTFGVLKLELDHGRYGWDFLPVAGQTSTDSGSSECRPDSPPVTTAELSGPLTDRNEYIGPVTVTLSAEDNLPTVANTEFRINDGPWTNYVGSFDVNESGTHTVAFRSTDHAGLVENVKSSSFTIDLAPPTGVDVSTRKSTLKPPNRELVNVGLRVLPGNATETAIEITTSEPEGKSPDIKYNPATGKLRLRAERLGRGFGRTYTITLIASDDAGNETTDSTTVFVPHDAGSGSPPPPPPPPEEGPADIVAAPGPDPDSPAALKIYGEHQRTIDHPLGEPSPKFGARNAACNLDNIGSDELIVGPGPGPGNGSSVRVMSGSGEPIGELPAVFPGVDGVELACGDVDGDTLPEIVVGGGASPDATSVIKVVEADGSLRSTFKAFADHDTGLGVRLATGDTRNDGAEEIIVSPGPLAYNPALVRVFDVDGTLRESFEPFDSGAGAIVASGDVAGDERDEVIASPGPQPLALPLVATLRADGVRFDQFAADDASHHLDGYGYHHIQDPRYGFNLEDTRHYTTLSHFGSPEFVRAADAAGHGAILELRLDEPEVGQSPADLEASWRRRMALVQARAGDDLTAGTLRAILIADQANIRPWTTSLLQSAIAISKEYFPAEVPRMVVYSDSVDLTGQSIVPPANLDWFGVDRFLPPGFDNNGCADRDLFESGPLAQLRFASEWASAEEDRRVLMFAPSFDQVGRAMPSTCQQGWFMEAALSEREVIGLVWFMYGFVPENGTLGAGQFPDVLDLHEELAENGELGGFGTELATGNTDGFGHDEIVVGRGAGPSMLSRWSVFSSTGTEVGVPQEAFPGARFGVRLGAGRFN